MRRGPSYRHRYGLVAPVDVYPLYENAGRAAYGQTLAQGQDESAQIWSQFSAVAADNPGAWLRRRVSADEIKTVSPANRPIAFPYCKLMVANSSVNQGAGFIVTSLAEAQARGIDDNRLIFVGPGAAAHEAVDVLARANYFESPGRSPQHRRTILVPRQWKAIRFCMTAKARRTRASSSHAPPTARAFSPRSPAPIARQSIG
jgi:acetyl-CoA C-acetyltransferase